MNCSFSKEHLVDVVFKNDSRFSVFENEKDFSALDAHDTLQLSCGIKLYTFNYFDLFFSVIESEQLNLCEILDSDDLTQILDSKSDIDDLTFLRECLKDCSDLKPSDIRSILEHMYFLYMYQQSPNNYSKTLDHLSKEIPNALFSSGHDSLTIVKKIDSVLTNQQKEIEKNKAIYFYYPNYTEIVSVSIDSSNPLNFKLSSYDIEKER
ncbi:MAG: hypothetical protein R3D00_16295 [Bacteroidia bacterium]